MNKKVLVVDLDGTLYTINTFHYFIKYLLLFCIKNLNLVLLVKVGITLFFRMLKLCSHARMKYDILNLISSRTDIDYQKFVNSISSKKRDITKVNDATFDMKILATAAPSCYANIIAENEQFQFCLGTNFSASSFNKEFENIKDMKKNNVMAYLMSKGITEIDTLITDHIDDLPLMKLANRNIIIEPNELFLKQLNQNLITFEIIK